MCCCCSENNRCVQAKGRGTIRSAESQVDKVDAEDVLSMLLRSRMSDSEPGLLIRGWSQSCRSEASSQHCA